MSCTTPKCTRGIDEVRLLRASAWRHVAAGAVLALLAGVGTAVAAPTPLAPGLGASPAAVAAAGPEDQIGRAHV